MGCLSSFSWCERSSLASLNFSKCLLRQLLLKSSLTGCRNRFRAHEVVPSVQCLLWRPEDLNSILSTYIKKEPCVTVHTCNLSSGSRGREIPETCWASRLAESVCSRLNLRFFLIISGYVGIVGGGAGSQENPRPNPKLLEEEVKVPVSNTDILALSFLGNGYSSHLWLLRRSRAESDSQTSLPQETRVWSLKVSARNCFVIVFNWLQLLWQPSVLWPGTNTRLTTVSGRDFLLGFWWWARRCVFSR